MEEPGSIYLFNLSLIAMTFTAVTALVMFLRQTMGGKLSNFDIYLITSFISFGFAQSLSAILPPLISLFELPSEAHWALSSGLAAILLGFVAVNVIRLRRTASSEPKSLGVKFSFSLQGLAVIVLIANAVVWPWQGVHLFAAALTLSLAAVMWAFARRIASLFGDKPGEDWDPKRG